ncbi:hypothetical protein LSH36_362g04039 [Paralvinella palmiformis]|uniref:Uncharacterized protein n=1 Tax=Paralvinella palmiformis TaxID=53620 RepID=A0AAD9JF49_9ANNE|nr:hypothetical protein LSH36_362g04039 [Paralvinella palmiformis]
MELVQPSILKQHSTLNCDLFLIANVPAPCQGLGPASWKYDQSKMRAQLLSCFFNSCKSSFPGSRRYTRKNLLKVQQMIYLVFRWLFFDYQTVIKAISNIYCSIIVA